MKVIPIDFDSCPNCGDSLFCKSETKKEEGSEQLYTDEEEVFCGCCNYTSCLSVDDTGVYVQYHEEECSFCGKCDHEKYFGKVCEDLICQKCAVMAYKHLKSGETYIYNGSVAIKSEGQDKDIQGILYSDKHCSQYVREREYFRRNFVSAPIDLSEQMKHKTIRLD